MLKNDLITERFNTVANSYYSEIGPKAFYDGPRVLHDAFSSYFEMDSRKRDILDLGCGTGLLGKHFKPYSNKLAGVDLSEAMLANAEELEVYDSLVIADISTFCGSSAEVYDVVISNGVFQYFQNLEELFILISRVLQDNGYLVFNVDKNYVDSSDYRLSPEDAAGLVACHSHNYISRVADLANFKVLKFGEYFDRSDWNSSDKKIVSMYHVMRKM